jgi:hypothetical protein
MRLFLTSLLLATLLGLSQCKNTTPAPAPIRQVDLLPPPTQTGRRTFGCLLNGKAWNLIGNPSRPAFTADYTYRRLRLSALGGIDSTNAAGLLVGGSIGIEIDDLIMPKEYILATRDSSALGYNDTKCTYYTNATHSATVTITRFDGPARIVSGTFSCTLETPNCGKVVITEGRFDTVF